MANQQAAARVSRRLSISVREVNEALKKCRVAETAETRLERDIAEAERQLKGK